MHAVLYNRTVWLRPPYGTGCHVHGIGCLCLVCLAFVHRNPNMPILAVGQLICVSSLVARFCASWCFLLCTAAPRDCKLRLSEVTGTCCLGHQLGEELSSMQVPTAVKSIGMLLNRGPTHEGAAACTAGVQPAAPSRAIGGKEELWVPQAWRHRRQRYRCCREIQWWASPQLGIQLLGMRAQGRVPLQQQQQPEMRRASTGQIHLGQQKTPGFAVVRDLGRLLQQIPWCRPRLRPPPAAGTVRALQVRAAPPAAAPPASQAPTAPRQSCRCRPSR